MAAPPNVTPASVPCPVLRTQKMLRDPKSSLPSCAVACKVLEALMAFSLGPRKS